MRRRRSPLPHGPGPDGGARSGTLRPAAAVATATLLLGAGACSGASSEPSGDADAPRTPPTTPDSEQTDGPSPSAERSPTDPTSGASGPSGRDQSSTGPARTGAPSASPPAPGTVAPPWLGTRVLPENANGFGEVRRTPPRLRHRRFTLPDTVPPLPGEGFASQVTSPPPRRVLDRSTWEPGCPVDASELAYLRLAFHGFDDRRHTGEMLVNAAVADDMVAVFGDLYRARFPLEEMRVVRPGEVDAPPTGDGNNTTAFVCRAVTGGSSFSQHAYGLAVDVNPFQNPYVKGAPGDGGVVLPELSSTYLDRDRGRPGVIRPGSPVVEAFAGVGWEWGGHWRSLKDYQHFSRNGR